MSFIVKQTQDKYMCPEGVYQAQCVDFIHEGIKDGKDRVRFVWAVNLLNPDQKPYLVSASYVASLYEKSYLRQDLLMWLGKMDFTKEELEEGIDLETFKGKSAKIKVIHKKGGKFNKTFANVGALLPGDGSFKYDGYVRPKLL